jgi:hypothetical protein
MDFKTYPLYKFRPDYFYFGKNIAHSRYWQLVGVHLPHRAAPRIGRYDKGFDGVHRQYLQVSDGLGSGSAPSRNQ